MEYIQRQEQELDRTIKENVIMDENDLSIAWHVDALGDAEVTLPKSNIRRFKAWMEDWEKEILYKNDSENEAKFLAKYGGLKFYDPDMDKILTILCEKMLFQKKKREIKNLIMVITC